MIVIVDYEMGNLKSISKMINKIGYQSIISNDINDIENASFLILPGVGHFARGMEKIAALKLSEVLQKQVTEAKTPILGICLGMQLMTRFSEEGNCNGLGWIAATTKKIPNFYNEKKLIVPHMGWNNAVVCKEASLLNDMPYNEKRFYFVHSYFVDCEESNDIWLQTAYGINFCSGFIKENIIGVQFHPEKSHSYGMELLRNIFKRYL